MNLPRQQYLTQFTPKWDAGRPRTLLLLSPTRYTARFVAHVLRREIDLQMGKLLADYFDECQVVFAPGQEGPA